MIYEEAVEYLNSLQLHKIKLGLESMQSFLGKVGNPQDKLRFVHVAGTNGKGSVCSALVSIFCHGGYNVGLYTSPHLSDVRERFRINDQYIKKEEFTLYINQIVDVLGEDKITYFECTTAIALMWFADKQPDFVVLETGLGGRLDATNVVRPMVSVITNISLDHELYLGNTLTSVAKEKAGIIKHSIPVVSGVIEDESAKVIRDKCNENYCSLYELDSDFIVKLNRDDTWSWRGQHELINKQYLNITCGLKGTHQPQNMSLVLAVVELLKEHDIEVDDKQVRKALKTVHWPGRLEEIIVENPDIGEVKYLLDGGHNPAGIASLFTTIKKDYKEKELILVWAAMADKDSKKTLPVLEPLVDKIILTKPDSDRSAEPQKIVETLDVTISDKCTLTSNIDDALKLTENLYNKNSIIVVAGSLYLVGAVRGMLVGSLVEE